MLLWYSRYYIQKKIVVWIRFLNWNFDMFLPKNLLPIWKIFRTVDEIIIGAPKIRIIQFILFYFSWTLFSPFQLCDNNSYRCLLFAISFLFFAPRKVIAILTISKMREQSRKELKRQKKVYTFISCNILVKINNLEVHQRIFSNFGCTNNSFADFKQQLM